MAQIIFISVTVTSVIILMVSIYKLGVLTGRTQAYQWMETELEKIQQRQREKYLQQFKADIRRSDELLAADNGGSIGTRESTEAKKNI